MTIHRRAPILTGPAMALAVVGCSSGTGSVSNEELQDKVFEAVAAEVGTEPESVTCDDDLPAEVDAEVRCVLKAPNGDRLGVTVTASAIDGDDVELDIVVDDELME